MGQVEFGPDALVGCWCPRKPSQAGAPCSRGREGPGKGSGSSPVYTSSPQTSQALQTQVKNNPAAAHITGRRKLRVSESAPSLPLDAFSSVFES